MIPLSSDSPAFDEWRLLHELRATPRLLERASADGNELRVQAELRREYPADLVRAALGLVELRKKAVHKFSRAADMWFDRQGLEQATSELVATHKARRFMGQVWDLCCGIGGDAIALAEHCVVTAVDLNPASCLRTEWNAAVYGRGDHVTGVAQSAESTTSRDGLVHIDPDRRRSKSTRVVRVEDYVPGLEFLQQLTREFRGGAIKLSPASNFGGKFPGTEIELISLYGECKEATVWFGELKGETEWRATLLPSGKTLAGNPLDFFAAPSEVMRYVYDPDPAVVRAGLVDMAAERLGLWRLDDKEEYLTGEELVSSPFVQPFEVVAELGTNPREIRAYFRTSQAGQVEIKCRHIPIDAESIRRKLPMPGNEPLALIFARVQGKSRALVCRRITLPAT
jgi:hypothetical protein